jgi:rSAM-associated Gly-rich repeat protein
MTHHPRSGLFGFLLLLAALAPAAAGAKAVADGVGPSAATSAEASSPLEAAPGSIDARLRRISQAMGQESPGPETAKGRAQAPDGRLAFTFVNGPGVGWGNGGFRNGGWGNGGFRNGGWGNGGFRNGGWGNGGFRNGGFRNFW